LRPVLELADASSLAAIRDEALELLEEYGCSIESERALKILADSGATVDLSTRRAKIPASLVEKALSTVPNRFDLFNSAGDAVVTYGSGTTHFDPGSAALLLLDSETREARYPETDDYLRFLTLTEQLDHIDAHSTALIVKDIPKEIVDRYRFYLALKYGIKPVVTGAFAVDGVKPMHDLLVAAVGNEENARKNPRAIFDVCPAPPLLWSEIGAENLIDCAMCGLPVELVSMPLSGASAPVTIIGSVVQHAAENFTGIVMHQLVAPGSPIVYGGSPAFFDMRKGTPPLGAIETMMIESLYVQFGKSIGLPTHAYMGLSDAKVLDSQTGMESAMGILIGTLSGVDMISGPGMLDFESCQSMEKLVIDNEICGMAKRLARGVSAFDRREVVQEFLDVGTSGNFLSSMKTLHRFEDEAFLVSGLVDRDSRERWLEAGGRDIVDRAKDRVRELTARPPERALKPENERALEEVMLRELKPFGVERLPA
jgi:trimethylamine--corrinoid protein Co-methyltransferase